MSEQPRPPKIIDGLQQTAVPIETLTEDPDNARKHGARDAGVFTCVGYNYRWAPAVQSSRNSSSDS